ncbi:MAG: hypothetical protein IJA32_01330 [Lachnospiraceae bacterium]|nr:hypothetical protein [Lachnospiraceae bacterium]
MNKSEAISIINKYADTYKKFSDEKKVVFVYRYVKCKKIALTKVRAYR